MDQSHTERRRDFLSPLHTALMSEVKKEGESLPREACMEYRGLMCSGQEPLIRGKIDELVQSELPVLISWVDDGTEVGLEGRGAGRGCAVTVRRISRCHM